MSNQNIKVAGCKTEDAEMIHLICCCKCADIDLGRLKTIHCNFKELL